MASDLPRYVAFGLRPSRVASRIMWLQANSAGGSSLTFDRSEVIDRAAPTLTKFELEPAKAGNGRFTHIRSCHNNKYLSRRNNTTLRITASADQPEEDQSNQSCTLFELLGDSSTVELRHVATGVMAVVNYPFLALDVPGAPDYGSIFILDWGSIVIFPEFVTIKGDNGLYLSAQASSGNQSLRFITEDNITNNKSIMYRVAYLRDGRVRLHSTRYGYSLRRVAGSDVNAVWVSGPTQAGPSPPFTASDTIFQPTKVQRGSNKVVLRNVGSGRFCERTNNNYLRANSIQANLNSSILEVDEAVFSRSIYNVRYRLIDARIYDEAPVPITRPTSNFTSSSVVEELKFERKLEESTSWDRSITVGAEVKTTFLTGAPFLIGGELTISVHSGYENTWGETKTTTREVDITHTVIVPPRTFVNVTLVATRGTCDIPFSYTRRDILMDGRQVITDHNDGLYTGVSHYNFKYETTRRDL